MSKKTPLSSNILMWQRSRRTVLSYFFENDHTALEKDSVVAKQRKESVPDFFSIVLSHFSEDGHTALEKGGIVAKQRKVACRISFYAVLSHFSKNGYVPW